MKEEFSNWFYYLVRWPLLIWFRLMHPVTRFEGKENLIEGPAMICANHSAMSDIVWIVLGSWLDRIPRTMAKKEVFKNPMIAWVLYHLGGFPVDREGNDIMAVKRAMMFLKNGEKVMIFPEGTRIRKGKVSQPHDGAMVIANRMRVPIIPVYISTKKHLFSPIRVVFGEAYVPTEERKPSEETVHRLTAEMMEKIYALGSEK